MIPRKLVHKSELRIRISPLTHAYLREHGAEIGIGAFVEALVIEHQNVQPILNAIKDKLKVS